jgi:hypothetical protein
LSVDIRYGPVTKLGTRISIPIATEVQCLHYRRKDALAKYGKPEIFNTDHPSRGLQANPCRAAGSQFTSFDFTGILARADRSGSVCLNSLVEFYKWISALLLCGNRDWLLPVEVNLIGCLPVK